MSDEHGGILRRVNGTKAKISKDHFRKNGLRSANLGLQKKIGFQMGGDQRG